MAAAKTTVRVRAIRGSTAMSAMCPLWVTTVSLRNTTVASDPGLPGLSTVVSKRDGATWGNVPLTRRLSFLVTTDLPLLAPGVMSVHTFVRSADLTGRPCRYQCRVERRRVHDQYRRCLLYTSPSPRDRTRSRMPS